MRLIFLLLLAKLAGASHADCDFNDGLYGWTQGGTDQIDWVRSRYNETLFGEEMISPADGHYIYLDNSYPRRPNDTARLVSVPLVSTSKSCLTFKYFMVGPSVGTLIVYKLDGDRKVRLWSKKGTQRDEWITARVKISTEKKFQLILEGVRDVNFEGRLAVDDIRLDNKQCSLPHLPELCDFEDGGVCSFGQLRDRGDAGNWKIGNIEGNEEGNKYLYVTANSQMVPLREIGYNSTIRAAVSRLGLVDIQFKYKTSASNLLHVYLDDEDTPRRTLGRSSDTGAWKVARVRAYRSLGTYFFLLFQAQLEYGNSSFVAVDDVVVLRGSRNGRLFGSCMFTQGDECLWENVDNLDQFDWMQKDDNLVLSSSSRRHPGDTALYWSPSIPPKEEHLCFEIRYRCSNSGFLTVYYYNSSVKDTVMSQDCQLMSGQWRTDTFPFTSPRSEYWFELEGLVGYDIVGNIEIDFIDISPVFFRRCPATNVNKNLVKPTLATSISSSTTLASPQHSGSCWFNQGDKCFWENAVDDDQFDWRRTDGSLVLNASSQQQPGDTALYWSPSFSPTQERLCFDIRYRCSNSGFLTVYYYNSSVKDTVMSQDCQLMSGQWRTDTFPFTSPRSEYWFELEGKVGNGIFRDIEVDYVDIYPESPGRCVGSSQSTAKPSTTTPSLILSTRARELQLPCDFEDGFCEWSEKPEGGWQRVQGPTSDIIAGPARTERGYYMYAGTGGRHLNTSLKLLGNLLFFNDFICLQFRYNIDGQRVPEFWVGFDGLPGHSTKMWARKGTQGNGWKQAEISLRFDSQIKIKLVLENDPLFKGHVAVDDIGYTPLCKNKDLQTDCDFEVSNRCAYEPDFTDQFPWKFSQGIYDDIKIDHTLRTPHGQYLAIFFSQFPALHWNRTGNFMGRVISPRFEHVTAQCFSFMYRNVNASQHSFRMYLTLESGGGNVTELLWTASGSYGRWSLVRTTINITARFYKIVLEAKPNSRDDRDGASAIDDIQLADRECPPLDWCDFEGETCPWTNVQDNDQIDWQQVQSRQTFNLHGPVSDHSLGSSSGHYLYIDNTQPSIPGENAQLLSQIFAPSENGSCLTFWFVKSCEDKLSSLSVLYVHDDMTKTSIWEHTPSALRWTQGGVFIPSTKTQRTFSIMFEGVVGYCSNGYIGLDDLKYMEGPCPDNPNMILPKPEETGSADCDFKPDLCEWSQHPDAQLRWIHHLSYSDKPIPLLWRYKMYVYLESDQSIPLPRGASAVLQSPLLRPPLRGLYTFTFYYIAYGPITGQLNAYVQQDGDKRLVWWRPAFQTNAWTKAEFSIATTTNFKILIEAKPASTWRGHFALANFNLEGSLLTPQPIDCSFDTDLCEYTTEPVTKDDWKWTMVSHSHNPDNPDFSSKKHGLAGGSFVKLFATHTRSRFSGQDTARLVSGTVSSSQNRKCLSFFYYIAGNMNASLGVYILTNESEKTMLWSKRGVQEYDWSIGQISIQSNVSFQIIFEGLEGDEAPGSIGIDEILLQDKECPAPASCSFSASMCGYTAEGRDFVWMPYSPSVSTISYNRFPTRDASSDFRGTALVAALMPPIQEKQKAVLKSSLLEPTDENCVRFFYSIIGDGDGDLLVYQAFLPIQQNGFPRRQTTSQLLLRVNSVCHVKDVWIEQQLSVNSSTSHYLEFHAVMNNRYSNMSVSVDEIVYGIGPCDPQLPVELNDTSTCMNCTFDTDLCGYDNDSTSDFIWTRSDDDIELLQNNSFLFLSTSAPGRKGDKSRLLSQFQGPTGTFGVCLTFKYALFGSNSNTLNIYKRTSYPSDPLLWSRSRSTDYAWKQGQVHINSDESYVVIFEGVIDNVCDGYIAVDEISTTVGACSATAICDFESNACGFFQPQTRSTNAWERQHGEADHTTNNHHGSFMIFKPWRGRGELVSPVHEMSSPKGCLMFWYLSTLSTQGTNVSAWFREEHGSGYSLAWRTASSQLPGMWHRASADATFTNPIRVIFIGEGSTGSNTVVAIDDILLTNGTCPPRASCNFEEGSCGFHSDYCPDCNFHSKCHHETFKDTVKHFHWLRNRGVSSGDRPPVDHTTNTAEGHFLYISGNASHGKAQLFGDYTSLEQGCLSFWYFASGSDTSSLSAHTIHNFTSTEIWCMGFAKKSQWDHVQVNISVASTEFLVVFEGRITSPEYGFLALDDVNVTQGFCTPPDVPAGYPTSSMTCNFDGGLCSWNQSSSDDIDWQQGRPVMSPVTGPTFQPQIDHSSPFGSFLFIARTSNTREIARLESPLLPPTPEGGLCLAFWYYLFGPAVGKLSAYLLSGGNSSVFWSKSGTQLDNWIEGQRTLKSSVEYKIVFEATLGRTPGIMAIDDILLTEGACKAMVKCSFDDDLCTWNLDTYDKNVMQQGQSNDLYGGKMDVLDHTHGSDTGKFIYVETSKRGDTMWVSGSISTKVEVGKVQHSPSCLTFWFINYGSSSTQIKFWEIGGVRDTELLAHYKSDRRRWMKKYVELPERSSTYSIQLSTSHYVNSFVSPQAFIAIDDIAWEDGTCPNPGTCTFERDMCDYLNENEADDLDWLLGQGHSPHGQYSTGPVIDHTLGASRGQYIYFDLNNGVEGNKAQLTSTLIKWKNPRKACLTFHYYTYGEGGTLNVYSHTAKNNRSYPIFTLNASEANIWRKEVLEYSPPDRYYNIIFEGVIGQSHQGVIALDDLDIFGDACMNTTSTKSSPGRNRFQPDIPELDCTFEDNLCSWSVNDSNITWIRTNRINHGSSPLTDQMPGDRFGYFLLSSPASSKPNRIESPDKLNFLSRKNDICVSFWYHMYGSYVGDLNVYFSKQGVETKIWSKSRDQGNEWHFAQIFLKKVQNPVSFIFEAIGKDIAIDDIVGVLGSCHKPAKCDFESDQCGFTQSMTNNFDWSDKRSFSVSKPYLPVDHTLGTHFGNYVFIEPADSTKEGDTARIETPEMDPTDGSCLQLWYNVRGDYIGRINIYQREGTRLHGPLKVLKNADTGSWESVELSVTSSVPFQLSFEAVLGKGDTGYIAIDDVQVRQGLCVYDICSFENGFCQWENVEDNSPDWISMQGLTASQTYAPKADHSLRTKYGAYIFLTTPAEPSEGGQSKLILKTSVSGPKCLRFWHIISNDSGEINVMIQSDGQDEQHVKTILGSERNTTKWAPSMITLRPTVMSLYKVILSVDTNSINLHKTFAIDDISVEEGVCPSTSQQCFQCSSDTSCVSYSKVCNFQPDCPESEDESFCGYDCNFDEVSCGWRSDMHGNFIWRIMKTTNNNSNAGPLFDRSPSGLGYYLALVATGSFGSHVATYTSPTLQRSSPTCFVLFWFYMAGTDIGSLSVIKSAGSVDTELWTMEGDQGHNWHQALVKVGRMVSDFTIILQAKRSYTTFGGIAVDDIRFMGCNDPGPSTCLLDKSQFFCNNGACIDRKRQCDFYDDCGDGSDETDDYCNQRYSRCNFEKDTCLWRWKDGDSFYSLDPDFRWSRKSGEMSLDAFPVADHTLRTVLGHFLFLDMPGRLSNNQEALIASQVFEATSDNDVCYLTFFYIMYGDKVPSLDLLMTHSLHGPMNLVWRQKVNTGIMWIRQEIPLLSKGPFQLVFRSTDETGTDGFIAVDDVSFSPGCVSYGRTFQQTLRRVYEYTFPVQCGNDFRCDSNECIPHSKVCNFLSDCTDGSDEINCGSCDFETGACGWFDVSPDLHQWRRMDTSPQGLRPPVPDHTKSTCGSGHYLISTPSDGLVYGPATLLSPVYGNIIFNLTMSFWFHTTFGDGILNLYRQSARTPSSKVSDDNLLWSSAFVSAPHWVYVEMRMGQGLSGHRLVFKASPGVLTEFRIDDISFQNISSENNNTPTVTERQNCINSTFVCQNGQNIPISKQCDFSSDCADGSDEKECPSKCDFTTSSCGWVSETSNQWIVTSGDRTRNRRETAPAVDGTEEDIGNYVLAFDAPSSTRFKRDTDGSSTVLRGPTFASSLAQCRIEFSYFIDRINGDLLKLFIHRDGDKDLLWVQNRNTNKSWAKTSISIGLQSDPFTLSFVKEFNMANVSIIAVDEIIFVHCGRPNDERSCLTTEFTCNTGGCVDKLRMCDLTNDCGDMSDENATSCAVYTKFDFEMDLGVFHQAREEDGAEWIRKTAQNLASGTSPIADHTTGLATGHFLYLAGFNRTRNANLTSRFLDSDYFWGCSVLFYLFMSEHSQLKVYTKNRFNEYLLLEEVGQKDQSFWKRITLSFESGVLEQLVFEGSVGSSESIAIDDVIFSRGCIFTNVSAMSTTSHASSSSSPPISTTKTTLNPFSTFTSAWEQSTLPAWDRSTSSIKATRSTSSFKTTQGSTSATTTSAYTTTTPSCSSFDEFLCRSGERCIKRVNLCDGEPDCMDGSDEENCQKDCKDSICSRGGICTLGEDKQPVCRCFPNFTGRLCETQITSGTPALHPVPGLLVLLLMSLACG